MSKNYKIYFITAPGVELKYFGITTQKISSFKANIINKYKHFITKGKGNHNKAFTILSYPNSNIYLYKELNNITKEQANTELYKVLQEDPKAINNITDKNYLLRLTLYNSGLIKNKPDIAIKNEFLDIIGIIKFSGELETIPDIKTKVKQIIAEKEDLDSVESFFKKAKELLETTEPEIITAEPKPEAKPEITAEPKPEAKPEITAEPEPETPILINAK